MVMFLIFDKMGILWVLGEKGIQGYEVTGNDEITLDPFRKYLIKHTRITLTSIT